MLLSITVLMLTSFAVRLISSLGIDNIYINCNNNNGFINRNKLIIAKGFYKSITISHNSCVDE